MPYYLGLDVGFSKTRALVADDAGNWVGAALAPGGNRQAVGYKGFAHSIHQAVTLALANAALPAGDIAMCAMGIAGYDFPAELPDHQKAIRSLRLPFQTIIANDAVLGLYAGTNEGIGVNVSAGSGINCRGRGQNGQEGRIVGNGVTFGEFGGASEMVWKGLQAVNYAWIKRNPPTMLTRHYLEAVGALDEMDLMEGISNGRYQLPPTLATRIFAAAQLGDAAAEEVVRWAGEELAWLAISVARQIGLDHTHVQVVGSGSLFKAGKILIDPFCATLGSHMPDALFKVLEVEPVTGAVLMAMQAANANTQAARATLLQIGHQIT